MIGEIYTTSQVSAYQPEKAVIDFTGDVKKEYSYGDQILNRSWEELNNYSVIDRMNKDQRTFNALVNESVEDPNEAWKWRGTRSMARNRTMAMHAHLTSQFIVPNVFAQNDEQEEDKDMANVMRDILEWMTVNSSYRSAFLLVTQGMLVNPVSYLTADYNEVYQKIKERTEQGYTKQEIIDEELSGFQPQVLSANQVLITNAFNQNIQHQRSIIKRRYIEYSEAKALYGEHANFVYVQSGVKSIYNDEDGLFYDIKDDDHPHLVEEATYMCRRTDTEVVYINGIYMGDDDVEWNTMKHRDHRNAPKYDVVPFGYERINEHFYFYKSLVNRVGWDDKLLDAMYELTMNREILDLLPPVAITGAENVDTQIVFPAAVASFADPNVKINAVLPPRNNASGYNAMQKTEQSIQEGSVSDVQMGQLPEASQKAYSVQRAEQNARTLLSGVGKSLGISVAQYGQLMIDIALQHLTVAQIDEISGAMKYRSFILENQKVGGKNVSKNIRFEQALVGARVTEDEEKTYNLRLLAESGYPESKNYLYVINPHLFSKLYYLIRVEPDTMLPKNEGYEKALMAEVYQMFRQDPLINPEALVREVAYAFFRGKTDDMIAKQSEQMMGAPVEAGGSQMGNMAKQSILAGEMASMA